MKTTIAILAVATALLQSSCVVGRRTTDLYVPQATEYPASKGAVSIGQIRDMRRFENKPSDPSVPSIDGDVRKMDAGTQSVMIGRQRNTYGMAIGDIALPQNRTVAGVSRELLAESLKRRGYSIADSKADKSIDADINEFWAWFSPGMWTVSFEARVRCTLVVKRNSDAKTVVIEGYGSTSGVAAHNAYWRLAYQRAFDDFLSKSSAKLQNAGL